MLRFSLEPPVVLYRIFIPRAIQSTESIKKRLIFLLDSQFFLCDFEFIHPRRPRGSQSGREKRRDESFQVLAKEPLGTDSQVAISKTSSGCRLLIGHKKCFVLLCPIGEQFLLSSFREFVHDGCCFFTLARFIHQACASKGNFYFLLS